MSDVESSEPRIWREIKELEQREADAMLRADVSTLSALWSDDLLVNSTANLIADKKILLGVIADGRLRLKSYSRLTMRAVINGDTVITTGNESSQLEGPTAGTMLYCSYMNSWIRRDLAWQLFGRHVGLMSSSPADSKNRG
ncbi:MAG: nuclear transport factor 2 family protein [Candidatus Binataceae bacterium]